MNLSWACDRDHSAGNDEWRRRLIGIKIYGGVNEAVPSATEYVILITGTYYCLSN